MTGPVIGRSPVRCTLQELGHTLMRCTLQVSTPSAHHLLLGMHDFSTTGQGIIMAGQICLTSQQYKFNH